jgi:hypothetical protein
VTSPTWLVLIHHLPPKPDYLRVKVRRKLQRIGAVALKNSVYVLPSTDEALEDFQWLRREITAEGGEAMLLDSDFLEGVPNGVLEQMGREERDREYRELLETVKSLASPSDADIARVRRQLADIVRRDHFGAPGRDAAEFAVRALGQRESRAPGETAVVAQKGATWVTRAGVKVDRMASAWLIRRWIDQEATFRFVTGDRPVTEPDEIRFDMFDGGFTHMGDRCTLEVLIHHFGLTDPALNVIAEVVHDIDVKDQKFARPETDGVAALIDGIVTTVPDDIDRLEAGALLFDRLYAAFSRKAA